MLAQTHRKVYIVDGDDGTVAKVNSTNNRLLVDAGTLTVGSIYTVPPHTFTKSYVGNQTDVTMVIPTAGKKLQIIGALITSNDSLFTITIEFIVSGKIVTEHFEQGTLGSYIPLNVSGATDEVLSLTIADSAAQNWFITINYTEVD